MAITAASKTTDFAGFLNPTQAAPIFERAARSSVVQQLVRQVPLSINATTIPIITGRPSAGWVGEGAQKPASVGALDLKTITPKKLAAILVVSAEVVRANPGNYVNLMRESLAESFAVSFDRAALHDEGPAGETGGGPFATNLDQTTKTQELGTTAQASGGTYGDLVAAIGKVVSDTDASGRRYRLTGWALDDVVEPVLLGSTDTSGRPLYIDTPLSETTAAVRPGRLVGRPSFMGEGVAAANLTSVVGYGGDFSQAAWGVIGGISYDVSTQATVTINGALTSLWENNLVAIRAEAEYGWLVNDPEAFIKLTNTNNSPVTST
jgi:HK97 family phage major capsid protein